MLVSEPKMTKCERCRRRYTNVKNEYLGYITCDFCEGKVQRELEAHFNRWVDSKVYDTLPSKRSHVVIIRDKAELWIVIDYIRSLITQTNSGNVEDVDEEDRLSEVEIKQLIGECHIGMYRHSLIMAYQNEEWQEILLRYRTVNLIGTRTTVVGQIGG